MDSVGTLWEHSVCSQHRHIQNDSMLSCAKETDTYANNIMMLCRLPDAPAQTVHPKILEVLDAWDEITKRPGIALDMDLQRGDIQLISNHVVVHSRTGYTDEGAEACTLHELVIIACVVVYEMKMHFVARVDDDAAIIVVVPLFFCAVCSLAGTSALAPSVAVSRDAHESKLCKSAVNIQGKGRTCNDFFGGQDSTPMVSVLTTGGRWMYLWMPLSAATTAPCSTSGGQTATLAVPIHTNFQIISLNLTVDLLANGSCVLHYLHMSLVCSCCVFEWS